MYGNSSKKHDVIHRVLIRHLSPIDTVNNLCCGLLWPRSNISAAEKNVNLGNHWIAVGLTRQHCKPCA
jgi:hypothetical protein